VSKVSVLAQVEVCPKCHKAFIPEIDICDCPEPSTEKQPGKDPVHDDVDE
jgi:hypothetical protein